MKKVMIIIAVSFMFAACGGSAEQTPATDSLKVDSAVVADTAAQVADSSAVK